ncbi:hypothetical protein Aperf_G00000029695 [Anoplocephala perfoliata]
MYTVKAGLIFVNNFYLTHPNTSNILWIPVSSLLVLILHRCPVALMTSTFIKEFKFYVSLAYGSLICSLGLRNWYDRISDRIVLGALPILPKFDSTRAKERITHVVSMVEPHENKAFVLGPNEAVARGLNYINLPVEDFVGVPTNDQVDEGMKFIDSCRLPGDSVYVHCKAGRTRSAYIVVCYFMRSYSLSVEEAIALVKNCRPHIVFNPNQLRGLHSYYHRLHGKQ